MAGSANGPIEIVFCFDTTGSMLRVINEVKEHVTELTERLLADIPAIRIGILAHGDYGDEPYLLQHLDLTSDGVQLRQFIDSVHDTCGRDTPECYELALHEVRTSFTWSPDARKRLVIIGDAEPHDIKSARNERKLDWEKETTMLRDELHMVIYSVQAYPNSKYDWFWKGMADMTAGKHLQLSDFSSIFDFLMAICYLEHGVEFFEAFRQEVRSRDAGAPSADVSRMLTHLGGGDSDSDSSDEATTAATPPAPTARAAGARRPPDATLRSTRRGATMKAKRAAKTLGKKRLRRAAALSARPKRETEAFSGATLALQGHWSEWHVLASPEAPQHAPQAQRWRPLGHGFLRTRLPVPAAAANTRVLVELAVAKDDEPSSLTPLFSRILPDSANNATAAVLRANAVLKWRLHRALTQRRQVLLRFACIATDGRSLRQQRHQLRKSNSYAWNSGRLVTGRGPRDLLSVPAPRARLLAQFLSSLAAERAAQA